MKKLLILFLLICSTAYAEDVVKYSGTTFESCQSIGDSKVWLTNPNDITTPKDGYLYVKDGCRSLPKVESRFLEVKDGKVIEKAQADKDAILAADALAIQTSKDLADSKLEVTQLEVWTAWVQLYNSKVPVQYQITKSEIVTKIKANR